MQDGSLPALHRHARCLCLYPNKCGQSARQGKDKAHTDAGSPHCSQTGPFVFRRGPPSRPDWTLKITCDATISSNTRKSTFCVWVRLDKSRAPFTLFVTKDHNICSNVHEKSSFSSIENRAFQSRFLIIFCICTSFSVQYL